MAERVRRYFVRAQGRGFHFLRAGNGPPVVLLHAGMSSARSVLPLLERLAADHTVIAFDLPGYGETDSIPKRKVNIADAADALSAALAALKMPRCPAYGSHTGGAVALEMGRRRPEQISAVIMDGPTVFTAREAKFFTSEQYLPPFKVSDDGSHLFANWTKTRDSMIWFPWSVRRAANRLSWPFRPAEGLHQWFLERLRAGDGYRAVYGAAFDYDANKAIKALRVPATFMAQPADLIYAHLDRLPKLKPDQRIARYPSSPAYFDEVARTLRGYRVRDKAPPHPPLSPTRGAINRRYVDFRDGQILVRSAGESVAGRPLLLLHDGRASSRMFEPLMREMAPRRAVYAPDLPDNGASDPFVARRPAVADYADAAAQTVAALKLAPCDVYAVGAGAAVALDLLSRREFAQSRVILETPDFYSPALARRLARDWAPPLQPEWDGAHLNRLWLMLRDEYAFWPWFDKSSAAACALDAPTDWQEMHARVTEILRSLATYHRLTAAALRYDWPAKLRRAGSRRVTLVATANDPRRPHAEAAARSARLADVAAIPAPPKQKARALLRGAGSG